MDMDININKLKKRFKQPSMKQMKDAFNKLNLHSELSYIELSYILTHLLLPTGCDFTEEETIEYVKSYNIPNLDIQEVIKETYELIGKTPPTPPSKLENDTLKKEEIEEENLILKKFNKRITPSSIKYISNAFNKLKKQEILEEKEIEKILEHLLNPLESNLNFKEVLIYLSELNNPNISLNSIKDILKEKYGYIDETDEKKKALEIDREIKIKCEIKDNLEDEDIFVCPLCENRYGMEYILLNNNCLECKEKYEKLRNPFNSNHICNCIADYILDNYEIISIVNNEKKIKEVLYYNEESFLYENVDLLVETYKGRYYKLLKGSMWIDVDKKVKTKAKKIKESRLNPPYILSLNNKVLYFNEKTREVEIKNPSKEFLCTKKIIWDYNPNAKCPKFENFISDLVEKEWIEMLWNIPSYSLWKANAFKKFFILIGETHSGKTKYTNILNELFRTNTAVVEVNHILKGDNPFIYQLKDNLICAVNDEKQTADYNVISVLKKFVGGDTITIRDLYKSAEQTQPYIKFIYAVNKMYSLDENDLASLDRIVLIEFINEFLEKPNPHISRQKKRIVEIDRLIYKDKEEMEGILFKCIEKLKVMYKEEKMNMPISREEMHEKIINIENPIRKYWKDVIIYEKGGRCSLIDIQNRFKHLYSTKKIQKDNRLEDYRRFRNELSNILNGYLIKNDLGEIDIRQGRITDEMRKDDYLEGRAVLVFNFVLKPNWIKTIENQEINSKVEKQEILKQRENYGKGDFKSYNEELTRCLKRDEEYEN